MKMMLAAATAALVLHSAGALAAAEFKIATADKRGTYFAIGADLAKYVAPGADISLEVMPTDGSAANIRHLRFDAGVKFAIVQADVYQAFVDRGSEGKEKEAARIISPLRVILPLYNTEIHYIARADSPYHYLHDLKDAKINGGLVGSGAAFITHTLYRMMFDRPMPEANATFMPNDEERPRAKCFRFEDKELNSLTFKGRAERRGWRRGSVIDSGEVSAYRKVFPHDKIEVFIGTEGMNVTAYADDGEVTLKDLFFVRPGAVVTGSYTYDEPRDENDDRLIKLNDVPPIVFSEVVADLTAITKEKEEAEA